MPSRAPTTPEQFEEIFRAVSERPDEWAYDLSYFREHAQRKIRTTNARLEEWLYNAANQWDGTSPLTIFRVRGGEIETVSRHNDGRYPEIQSWVKNVSVPVHTAFDGHFTERQQHARLHMVRRGAGAWASIGTGPEAGNGLYVALTSTFVDRFIPEGLTIDAELREVAARKRDADRRRHDEETGHAWTRIEKAMQNAGISNPDIFGNMVDGYGPTLSIHLRPGQITAFMTMINAPQ